MHYFHVLLPYLEWLALLSIFTFVLSLLLIPWYIGRLPENHFIKIKSANPQRNFSPLKIITSIIRNILGILLVAAGIIMLFLPGQGILTILIGILCMIFPGKRKLTLFLINRPSIQNSLNWTREKLSKSPFIWE